MESRQLAILSTLSYSDVFNHPLSLSEIHYFLQTEIPISLTESKKTLLEMALYISEQDGYYTFSDKKSVIVKRLLNEKIVIKKVMLARKIARLLMSIPSVAFIGISGAVAGGGAADEDDIDFFVITREGTLYTTRFLLLLLLQVVGKRRRRNHVGVKNKICLNMLIDKSSLLFTNDRHDLYTAREIAQIIPLFERDNTYALFLQANEWTRDILPNARGKAGCTLIQKSIFPDTIFRGLEPLLRLTQNFFIRRHSTREVIELSFLAFHPRDMKKYILTKYEKKLRHYIKCYTA